MICKYVVIKFTDFGVFFSRIHDCLPFWSRDCLLTDITYAHNIHRSVDGSVENEVGLGAQVDAFDEVERDLSWRRPT
jgi:hypothetical protein